MKKYVMPAIVAAAVAAGAPALAADLKPVYKAAPAAPAYNPWDVAVGAAVMTDYNFRGISQSDRGAAVSSYFEGRFKPTANVEWYAGVGGYSVKLPTDPSAEIDFYGGGRFTFDKFVLDLGVWYYYYPKERQVDGVIITAPPVGNTTLGNTDFAEIYGKLNWNPNDNWAFSAQGYYAWDWLSTGASGTYGALTLKYTGTALPSGWNWYVSGELGHYWLGTTDRVFTPTGVAVFNSLTNTGIDLPSYTTWNVGIGFTYKAMTIDLRYYDTDLNQAECNVLTGDPSATLATTPTLVTNVGPVFGRSNWCGSSFIGKLSFDTTLNALK